MSGLREVALIGTAQASESCPATGTAADALVAKRADDPVERRLLLAGGIVSVLTWGASPAPEAPAAPPVVPADPMPQIPPPAQMILERIVRRRRGWPEALAMIVAAKQRITPSLLPSVFGLPTREQRPLVASVAGPTGGWLAAQNPEWSWVLAAKASDEQTPLQETWDDGGPQARATALRQMRQLDRGVAQTWLEEIPKESAENRVLFLEAMSEGLAVDDGPFLETLWATDRSKRARSLALQYLLRIPGNPLLGPRCERARPLIEIEEQVVQHGWLRKMISGATKSTFTIALRAPQAFDKAWSEDSIEDKDQAGLGKKASWAVALIAQVPPTRWCEWLGKTPEELCAFITPDDFAILLGWSQAAVHYRERSWAPLLIQTLQPFSTPTSHDAIAELIALVDPDQVADVIVALAKTQAPHAWLPLIHNLPRPWPENISATWADGLRSAVAEVDRDRGSLAHLWVPSIPIAATAIPESMAAILRSERPAKFGWDDLSWQEAYDTFEDLTRLRHALATGHQETP